MKKNIGKGTEEFDFFGDYYKFLSEHYEPDNTENYFQSVIDDSEKVISKYKKCDFYILAKGILLLTAIWLSDVKFKGSKKGRWHISYEKLDSDCQNVQQAE